MMNPQQRYGQQGYPVPPNSSGYQMQNQPSLPLGLQQGGPQGPQAASALGRYGGTNGIPNPLPQQRQGMPQMSGRFSNVLPANGTGMRSNIGNNIQGMAAPGLSSGQNYNNAASAEILGLLKGPQYQQQPPQQQQGLPYDLHDFARNESQEFSLGNDDFPALPGFKKSTTSSGPSNDNSDDEQNRNYGMDNRVFQKQPQGMMNSSYLGSLQQEQGGLRMGPQQIGQQNPTMSQFEQFLPQLRQSGQQQQQPQQPTSPNDRFGLLGLLNVIRMTDQDLNTLALGTDLTTLGLNLNSPDTLYSTFGSPWSEVPSKREPEYYIPMCYYMQQPLHSPLYKINLFSDETLFYMFYCMPKDFLQVAAASELFKRDWRYHKEMKVWFTRIPGVEPTAKTQTFERGSYIYFDINSWERVRKDNFMLYYEQLETAPPMNQPQP